MTRQPYVLLFGQVHKKRKPGIAIVKEEAMSNQAAEPSSLKRAAL